MSFIVSNGNGESAESPTLETMRAFLEGLDPLDEEHGAAWVADDEDNVLEWEIDGNLAYSRSDRTRHMPQVSTDRVLALWQKLAAGKLDELEREPWQPGPRPTPSPEELETRKRRFADALLAQDRAFYDILGAERLTDPCRADGCARGSIPFSVFCRKHHFENVKGRSCPFAGAG